MREKKRLGYDKKVFLFMKSRYMVSLATFEESAAWVQTRYPHPISVVAVLGSGLGDLAETLQNAVQVPYTDIPGFPASTVVGHAGKLCLGEFAPGLHSACLQGRFHFYEGHPMEKVIYPLRVLKLLGAKTLIVTNSAGGINPNFKAGDLMLIEDHINLMGCNPLVGENLEAFGPRFPDMSEAYTPRLRELAQRKAQALGIPLQKGVYCAVSGPSYETPAEVRMIRMLGGDAVGMSTVPEVIVANQMGMQVLGISCITNTAAGVVPGHRLSHQEVIEAAEKAKIHFSKLLQSVVADLTLPISTNS